MSVHRYDVVLVVVEVGVHNDWSDDDHVDLTDSGVVRGEKVVGCISIRLWVGSMVVVVVPDCPIVIVVRPHHSLDVHDHNDRCEVVEDMLMEVENDGRYLAYRDHF